MAPDLATVYIFICTSPAFEMAFNICAPSILETVIQCSIPDFKHLARMLSIFGTFASSPNVEFQEFVDKYKTLPKDVLSTAPPSSAFMKDTPGPRYLVLTAYRISIFQKVCFMFLLTNVHEEMWSVSPNSTEETYSPIRESWTGEKFEAVAWWAPSWVEEMRLTRAYWNLFVYWNIYSISPHLKASLDDYFFTRYRATIADIDPTIGLSFTNARGKSIYEVDEMRCVLFTPLQFLGLPINSKSALPFTAGCSHSPDVQLEDWTFDLIDEHFHWWDKQPKPSTVPYGGQDRASFYRGNNTRAT